jgi:hypothetical protein
MKKYMFMSLIATFVMVLGANAQGNSYNMVIEMTNGTKINVGPNDIKNISFTDGQLTVSGESIDGIMNQISVLQMQVKSLMDEITAIKNNNGTNNGNPQQDEDEEGYETFDLGDPYTTLSFNPQGVLARLKVTVRYAADSNIPVFYDDTRVFLRRISLSGFAMKGSLKMSSIASGSPTWKDCNFNTTFYDGRKDGREGTIDGGQPAETPQNLNPKLIENYAAVKDGKFSSEKSPGINDNDQLLFTYSALSNTGDGYFYVIPRNQHTGMDIDLAYDVETIDPHLGGWLSDGQTHGITIENRIMRKNVLGENVDFEPGKSYLINIIVGMTSVKCETTISDWQ